MFLVDITPQEICVKANLENIGTLKSFSLSFYLTATKIKKCVVKLLIILQMHSNLSLIVIRFKEICNKAVNAFLVLQCNSFLNSISQEMRVKAVDTCNFVFYVVSDWYKTEEMCDKAVSYDPFMLKFCLDR